MKLPYKHKFDKRRLRDPESTLPLLISFPRTGSHYFRLLLEYYSDINILPISFFEHKEKNNFLLCTSHDMTLKCLGKNVIYLYRRDVSSVIFSILSYYSISEDGSYKSVLEEIIENYSTHFLKWIKIEGINKIVVAYEDLVSSNIYIVFPKVCGFLKIKYDRDKLDNSLSVITKEEVKRRVLNDKKVMKHLEDDRYEKKRIEFKEVYEKFIVSNFRRLLPDIYEKWF